MNISNILAPIDLANKNTQLIKVCFELASKNDSSLTFLHCYHPHPEDANLNPEEIEAKHYKHLESKVNDLAIAYQGTRFECLCVSGFAKDIILEYSKQDFDLIVLGTSQNNPFLFGKTFTYNILDKISLPMIIVPEQFRFVNLNIVLFNLEFEFREIEKIYELLIFNKYLGASLNCVHFSSKKNLTEARKNMNTYQKMFQLFIEQSIIDFDLIIDEKYDSIEKYANENEVDLMVLGKTRKTWKNQYFKTFEEKLGPKMNVPVMIVDI